MLSRNRTGSAMRLAAISAADASAFAPLSRAWWATSSGSDSGIADSTRAASRWSNARRGEGVEASSTSRTMAWRKPYAPSRTRGFQGERRRRGPRATRLDRLSAPQRARPRRPMRRAPPRSAASVARPPPRRSGPAPPTGWSPAAPPVRCSTPAVSGTARCRRSADAARPRAHLRRSVALPRVTRAPVPGGSQQPVLAFVSSPSEHDENFQIRAGDQLCDPRPGERIGPLDVVDEDHSRCRDARRTTRRSAAKTTARPAGDDAEVCVTSAMAPMSGDDQSSIVSSIGASGPSSSRATSVPTLRRWPRSSATRVGVGVIGSAGRTGPRAQRSRARGDRSTQTRLRSCRCRALPRSRLRPGHLVRAKERVIKGAHSSSRPGRLVSPLRAIVSIVATRRRCPEQRAP